MTHVLECVQLARQSLANALEMTAAATLALDAAEASFTDAGRDRQVAPRISDKNGVPLATAHRREHRPGRPPRLDADPELRAFVLARIESLTFEQIAKAVAESFPEERRVSKSTVHKWWQLRLQVKSHPR